MDPQLFCLRWNNHQTNLLSVFDQLLQLEAFCDVTLAVDGASIKCHKMVLAACSSYFQNLFMENDAKHPIVFLKDITFNQTRALLDYMYHGEVSVEEEELPALLDFAKALKVKGLVKDDESVTTAAKRSSKSHSNGGVNIRINGSPVLGQPGKLWPVDTSKLISPKSVKTEDEPGALVIDEESNDVPVDTDVEVTYNNDAEDTPPAPGMVKTIGPNGKVEWKRYKQYTKDDIHAAIEEVKNGMSALQASRKYGVPSRTLYDKVKKMGIMTANMQKQLQMKNKGSSSESSTPVKTDSVTSDNNFNPISLLGMQLPQSGLPQLSNGNGKVNGDASEPPFTNPFMLTMIEKIKAAGLNKPLLGEAPLNLSAMLDQSNGGNKDTDSDNDNSRSGSSSDGVVTSNDIKQETVTSDQDNIRAQFFADLKSLRTNEPASGAKNVDVSKLTPVPITNSDDHNMSSSNFREDEDNLPPRKRKVDIRESGVEEAGDCKKIAHDEDIESSIKLEATSC